MSYEDPFSAASAVEWFNGKDFNGAQPLHTRMVADVVGPASASRVLLLRSPCWQWAYASMRCLATVLHSPEPMNKCSCQPVTKGVAGVEGRHGALPGRFVP